MGCGPSKPATSREPTVTEGKSPSPHPRPAKSSTKSTSGATIAVNSPEDTKTSTPAGSRSPTPEITQRPVRPCLDTRQPSNTARSSPRSNRSRPNSTYTDAAIPSKYAFKPSHAYSSLNSGAAVSYNIPNIHAPSDDRPVGTHAYPGRGSNSLSTVKGPRSYIGSPASSRTSSPNRFKSPRSSMHSPLNSRAPSPVRDTHSNRDSLVVPGSAGGASGSRGISGMELAERLRRAQREG